MGGCRCAYRSCTKSTDGVTHFFHFPVKDPGRCLAWLNSCKRSDFTKLTLAQLKNKVICQYHFKDDMFLNYKHDRLIHVAVPTIEYYNNQDSSNAVNQPETPTLDLFSSLPQDTEMQVTSTVGENLNKSLQATTKENNFTMGLNYSPIGFKKERNIDLTKPFINIIQHHSTPIVTERMDINLSSTPMIVDETVKEWENPKNVEQNDTITKIVTINASKDDDTVINVEVESGEIVNTKNVNQSSVSPAMRPTRRNQYSKCNKPTLASKKVDDKKIIIRSVTNIPDKNRIDFVNMKNRTLAKLKHNKPKLSTSAIKVEKIINRHHKISSNNLSLPATTTQVEEMISQTPVMKKTQQHNNIMIIDEQLRRFNRERMAMNRIVKMVDSTPSPSKEKDEEKKSAETDYTMLLRNTQEELTNIKKMIQQNMKHQVVQSVEDPPMPKLSKEMLYASIVPYLSAELAKKVHTEMFPSLHIDLFTSTENLNE